MTKKIHGNGFVLTVVTAEPTDLFGPKKRVEEIGHDLPTATAAALRKENRIAKRHAKSDRVLMRKSSRRYGFFRSHRVEKLHKMGRRTIQ